MSCANCDTLFGDNGDASMANILSTWDINKPENTEEANVPVLEALSLIFGLAPMTVKTSEPFSELVARYDSVFKKQENEADFSLCSSCGQGLASLYNAFGAFLQIIRVEGELAHKLEALDDLRRQNNQNDVIEKPVAPKKQTGRRPQRKRARPKTYSSEDEDDDDDDFLVERGDNIGGGRKKRKSSKKKAVVVDEDSLLEEEEFELVKHEMLVGSDCELSDIELKEVDHFVVEGYNSREELSPPDSPVNIDFDSIEPRSPRPVRKSAARNKDWASFYKDEDEDPLEQDILEEELGEEYVQDAGNETEVTATEAEGEEGDEDAEVDPSDSALSNVQVVWQEDKDRDLHFDDDSDEDYRPDSDLENLLSLADESRPKKAKGPLKRERPSSKIFECDDCGKIYAHKLSLQRHKQTHLSERDRRNSFPCTECMINFTKQEYLKRHRRQVHGDFIPYKTKTSDVDFETLMGNTIKQACPVCQELVKRNELDAHVEDHGIESPWKCEICPSSFSTFSNFNTHIVAHNSERLKQICNVCKKVFRSLQHLTTHQIAIHHVRTDLGEDSSSEDEGDQEIEQSGDNKSKSVATKAKMYKCSECKKKYVRKEKLTEHLIIHGIGEKFKCNLCNREFTHQSSRRRHMYLHSTVSTYKCWNVGCRQQFGRKDHLIRHLDSIHGVKMATSEIVAMNSTPNKQPKPKEIPCPYCEKVIKRERMRLHLVSHTGERPHTCKVCGLKFGLRTTLRTHVQCVHQDVRKYACTFCPMKFKRSNHLKDHLKLHTEADVKPFQCSTCTKSFRREKNLKSHLITHFGGKEFLCQLCGKAFSRIDNMRSHVKAVHQGLQIRKKRTSQASSKSKKATTRRNANNAEEMPEMGIKLQAVFVPDVVTQSMVLVNPDNIINVVAPTIINTETTSNPASSVIMTTTSKKPYQPRKRTIKAKKQPSETVTVSTILNEECPDDALQGTPTIVTLAVDPSIGDVISADSLEAVQIEEIQREGEDGDSDQFDGQRTTIVQLAPGQVFPGTSGQYETTYYQYTYYQE